MSGHCFVAAIQAANGDPDLIAAAEREMTAALDAIEAGIDEATADYARRTR